MSFELAKDMHSTASWCDWRVVGGGMMTWGDRFVYLGRRKTPTFRRNVCSVSEEASVSERLNEQGKPL